MIQGQSIQLTYYWWNLLLFKASWTLNSQMIQTACLDWWPCWWRHWWCCPRYHAPGQGLPPIGRLPYLLQTWQWTLESECTEESIQWATTIAVNCNYISIGFYTQNTWLYVSWNFNIKMFNDVSRYQEHMYTIINRRKTILNVAMDVCGSQRLELRPIIVSYIRVLSRGG